MDDDSSLTTPTFLKFSFLLFGISSLAPWNAVLASLDFFSLYQPDYKPPFTYPWVNNSLNLICMTVLLFYNTFSTYKLKLAFSLILNVFILIAFPFPVLFLSEGKGFAVTLCLIIIQVFTGAVMGSTFFSVLSYLPKDLIVYFSFGQGIAGIIVSLIRLIILSCLSSLEPSLVSFIGAIAFFSVSGFILIVGVVLLFIVYQNNFFLTLMKESDENLTENSIKGKLLPKGESTDEEETEPRKQESKFTQILSIFHDTWDVNLIIALCFMITLSIYPGVDVSLKLFSLKGGFLNSTHTLIFNLFACLGRKLSGNLKLSPKVFTFIALLRFIFLVSFPLLYYVQQKELLSVNYFSLIVIFNSIICSFSNGLIITMGYFLGPQKVSDPINKGKCGACLILFQGIGLCLGSSIANFGMQKFMEYINSN